MSGITDLSQFPIRDLYTNKEGYSCLDIGGVYLHLQDQLTFPELPTRLKSLSSRKINVLTEFAVDKICFENLTAFHFKRIPLGQDFVLEAPSHEIYHDPKDWVFIKYAKAFPSKVLRAGNEESIEFANDYYYSTSTGLEYKSRSHWINSLGFQGGPFTPLVYKARSIALAANGAVFDLSLGVYYPSLREWIFEHFPGSIFTNSFHFHGHLAIELESKVYCLTTCTVFNNVRAWKHKILTTLHSAPSIEHSQKLPSQINPVPSEG